MVAKGEAMRFSELRTTHDARLPDMRGRVVMRGGIKYTILGEDFLFRGTHYTARDAHGYIVLIPANELDATSTEE